jgi:hypothetical protein
MVYLETRAQYLASQLNQRMLMSRFMGWDQFYGTYTYEVDCVSNRDQLFAAFQEGNENHWEIELDG